MRIKSCKIKILLHGVDYYAKAFCEQLENYKKAIFEPKYYERLNSKTDFKDYNLLHLILSPYTELNILPNIRACYDISLRIIKG